LRHILTVGVEDFFHADAFGQLIQPRIWSRFERRLERGTRAALDLCDETGAKATFFVLGWIAEVAPELVREIADRGHEVASRGYDHRSTARLTPSEFRDDLQRARAAIEQASGRPVLGHRAARLWYRKSDLWALDVLAAEGYAYDSSLAPLFREFADQPWREGAHSHPTPHGCIHELPVSTATVLGQRIPVAGGNYFRQLPETFVRREIARWMRERMDPFVMYFHAWELDPDQPRVAAPLLQRIRHYRNLDRMRGMLADVLRQAPFGSAADHLGLEIPSIDADESPASQSFFAPAETPAPVDSRTPVSIVVPCYQEERSIAFLANSMPEVAAALCDYDIRWIFVDDGSTDGTWQQLIRHFADRADVVLMRHPSNHGIAAAIRSGILRARSEIVCSIDADCSYDPVGLARMIPLLGPGVDMVTASPYHRDGTVQNVPAWRLALSRGLSRIYRVLLGRDIATWTSCYRVYRRKSVVALRIDRGDFLGIAELAGRMVLAGGRIVEHPDVLSVRVLGRSKLKVVRTIAGHIGLASELFAHRMRSALWRHTGLARIRRRVEEPLHADSGL
jgi:polysaccharide deacetylase family protein (PEP-CTERM system associated)